MAKTPKFERIGAEEALKGFDFGLSQQAQANVRLRKGFEKSLKDSERMLAYDQKEKLEAFDGGWLPEPDRIDYKLTVAEFSQKNNQILSREKEAFHTTFEKHGHPLIIDDESRLLLSDASHGPAEKEPEIKKIINEAIQRVV